MSFDLRLGDCLLVMMTMPDASVDAIVTDPPYGLSFMGKRWDYDVPSVKVWAECLRVLKPGGHLLAFAGTRTQHRMAVRIEDAGFEIRDLIAWVYGSGFPKSLDVSKAIDKAAGAEREVVGRRRKLQSYGNGVNDVYGGGPDKGGVQLITAPASPAAQQWEGWGTALKPALEPITMARKPIEGTVAANVLEHGTGALNVDGCRVAHSEECRMMAPSQANIDSPSDKCRQAGRRTEVLELKPAGRWPANLIHDGSDDVVGLFPKTTSGSGNKSHPESNRYGGNALFQTSTKGDGKHWEGDSGSAARFFYAAKASKSERGDGNNHPTVKPIKLMAYLCRLITPPQGLILDPFMGSGSTIKAAISEGFSAIGIEQNPDYFAIAQSRLNCL